MKKKILVTGGTGYIGSHTVVELQNAGFDVIIIDNLSNSSADVVNSIKEITGVLPEFFEFDLCDEKLTKDFFSSHKNIDAVIHFAAFKAVGESVEFPLKYYRNNIFSLVNVLEGMKTNNIKNFVFSSSCTVYGQPDVLPVTEKAKIQKPSSPYGNTKQISENVIIDTIQANPMNAIALRYFNPIGAHESALIGELPIGIPNNLIPFIANVFSWMAFALAITGVIAYFFGNNAELINLLVYKNGLKTSLTGLGWVVMLAPIGFVLLMSWGMNKLSAPLMILLFIVYSIIMGMSLSFIFLIYTQGSIAATFGITAGMFGLMAFVGYTTKTDLTKFGSIMFMGLIGIIIASVVNMFLQSGTMDYIISFIGVLVFTGLTAYDVQKLKRIGSGVEFGTQETTKLTILGALSLYLDFINLFLFMLRFTGGRR